MLQLSEQLDALREQVHSLEGQLQRKELALSASQGSLELLSAELRSKEAGWEERGREAARLHSQLSGEQDTLKGELAQTRTDNEALHSSTEQVCRELLVHNIVIVRRPKIQSCVRKRCICSLLFYFQPKI